LKIGKYERCLGTLFIDEYNINQQLLSRTYRGIQMKITKEQLKQIIKEELNEIEDIGAEFRPQEENQELVVVAFDALDEALEAVKALEPPFKFRRDSPITAADVDNKIHYINRSWRKIQGE